MSRGVANRWLHSHTHGQQSAHLRHQVQRKYVVAEISPIKYIMVGGFLGAGKTTTLSRLAQRYQAAGLNVGIVTNDQAEDLVDSGLLRNQGYDVAEVAGKRRGV